MVLIFWQGPRKTSWVYPQLIFGIIYLFIFSIITEEYFDRNNYLYSPSGFSFLLHIIGILSAFMILSYLISKTMTMILISSLNLENSNRLLKFQDSINYPRKWLLVSSYFNNMTKTDSKYLILFIGYISIVNSTFSANRSIYKNTK